MNCVAFEAASSYAAGGFTASRKCTFTMSDHAAPCNAVTRPEIQRRKQRKRRNRKQSGILTITQAARLLESATREGLPYIAIGLFAGLRRAEIERLDWSEIDFESGLIEVTADNAKNSWFGFIPLRQHQGVHQIIRHSALISSESG
jgi:integrase